MSESDTICRGRTLGGREKETALRPRRESRGVRATHQSSSQKLVVSTVRRRVLESPPNPKSLSRSYLIFIYMYKANVIQECRMYMIPNSGEIFVVRQKIL